MILLNVLYMLLCILITIILFGYAGEVSYTIYRYNPLWKTLTMFAFVLSVLFNNMFFNIILSGFIFSYIITADIQSYIFRNYIKSK